MRICKLDRANQVYGTGGPSMDFGWTPAPAPSPVALAGRGGSTQTFSATGGGSGGSASIAAQTGTSVAYGPSDPAIKNMCIAQCSATSLPTPFGDAVPFDRCVRACIDSHGGFGDSGGRDGGYTGPDHGGDGSGGESHGYA